MKWEDIKEAAGVGRITKQNQTVDVGPGEVKKQAAKFGNKVDKDGVPPTLSKKVKGSKTNVLFNLGLTESVAIKFERSDKYDILHIKEKGKNRVEVRGKKGYESGGYDPKDKLHRLLDSLGKAANISELMNGETVVLNPKHPDGPKAIDSVSNEGSLIPNPANTFITKSDTAYDHYKVGTNLANLKSMPKGANYDEPDVVIAPYAGKKEMKYLMKQLQRIGYDVQDAAGYKDPHYDEKPTQGKAPPQIKGAGALGKIKVGKLKSVQNERSYDKLAKQLERVLDGDYAPLQIDRKGRVVNGHHRLDALRLTDAEYARVYMVDDVLENMLDEGWSKKYKDSINCSNPKGFSQKAHCAGRKKTNEGFVKPQFDVEWDEATRYPEFEKLGKKAWIKLASKGKAVTIKSAKDINNTDAADPDSFKSLDKNKQARALAQLKGGDVEMPIVAVYSDGYKELIGGNTRLTAMMAQNGKATVWQFEVPDEVAELAENFADGKVKGKSRPGRVKKAGASCKGSVTSLRKKAKNSSGERAKMYHWCANMKSGRKK